MNDANTDSKSKQKIEQILTEMEMNNKQVKKLRKNQRRNYF